MTMEEKKSENGMVQGEGLVLVVDDEPIMRKIAINVLENSGYAVISAQGGEEAVAIFKEKHQQIKLVLLDLLMPFVCGKDAFFEMKQIDPQVKVLLVSGAKRDKRIDELLKAGVKGFVEKPYTFEYLSKKVFESIYNS